MHSASFFLIWKMHHVICFVHFDCVKHFYDVFYIRWCLCGNNSRKIQALTVNKQKSYLFFITWPAEFTELASLLFPGCFLFSTLVCKVSICEEIEWRYECKTANISKGHCYLSFCSLFSLYFVKIATLKMITWIPSRDGEISTASVLHKCVSVYIYICVCVNIYNNNLQE